MRTRVIALIAFATACGPAQPAPQSAVRAQDENGGAAKSEVKEYDLGERRTEIDGGTSEANEHPFFQKLAADVRDHLSTTSVANGQAVGCFHLTSSGTVVEAKLKESSGDADVDRAVQDAMAQVQKLRDDNPIPVPTELLSAIKRWICFRFHSQ